MTPYASCRTFPATTFMASPSLVALLLRVVVARRRVSRLELEATRITGGARPSAVS